VPGTVAGMAAALRRYGTISLARAAAPAESYARHGVRVTKALAATLSDKVNAERRKPFEATKAIYRPGGKALEAGALLKNPDLADSYARIRALGVKGFYGGRTAELIAQDMQRSPVGAGDERGRLDLTDLAKYRAKWRRPVTGTFRGRKVIGMPPPTSGGVAIQEMLNLLRGFDLDRRGRGSAGTLHLIAEAQKIAWADRGKYLGDPDFVSVPTKRLTSRSYAAKRRRGISLTRSRRPKPGVFKKIETGATTHVAVIDAKGKAVSVTCTIEQELGSTVVAPGTGILLNNEMTDFGDPGTANEARAGKRPRSSMSPEIVTEAGKPIAVTGGAGGSRIVMGTLFAILGRVEFGLPLASAVDAPRLDAQGELEDAKKDRVLIIENTRFRPSVLRALAAKGHKLEKAGEYDERPRVQAAGYRSPKRPRKDAVSDPRTEAGSLAQRR
jgi:gamma-glutamyltranspeptidase / glutathione hydrolase